MLMKNGTQFPNARKIQLITREIAGELLIYDRRNDRAHCLNNTAAWVWKHCDGRTSIETMASLLGTEMNTSFGNEVISLALDQLRKSQLLEGPLAKPTAPTLLTRRSLALKLGVSAAVAVPFIRSITAPTAAQAATCLAAGAACVNNSDCCSNNCLDNGRGAFECV